jgi:hypothetical protein
MGRQLFVEARQNRLRIWADLEPLQPLAAKLGHYFSPQFYQT